jgi:hypothetical protein
MEKFYALRYLLSYSLIVLCSGCTTPRASIPADTRYEPPIESQNTASIFGWRDERAFARASVFVRSVEGKRILDAANSPSSPIQILSGSRFITVELNLGGYRCTANFTIDAQVGGRYQIEYAVHPQGILAGSYCDFWLSDRATRTKITEVIRQPPSPMKDYRYIPFILPLKVK